MRIKNIYNLKKWTKREKIYKNTFWIKKKIYKGDTKKSELKNDIIIETKTFWMIIKKIFVALLLTLSIIIISIALDKFCIKVNIKEQLLDFFNVVYDKQLFKDFLIASIGIAGFLIALFYANLSGVFSSKYVFLSNRISTALLNHPINRKYINAILYYILIGLNLVALDIIGFNIDMIISIIFIILTMRIIIIFISLANNVFNYSDVINIANNSAKQILLYIKRVIVKNRYYDDNSFQSYHYNKTVTELKILEDLTVSLINDKDRENLSKLIIYNTNILQDYGKCKNMIPLDSNWYPQIREGKRWILENDCEIITAINTGTSLFPKSVKNMYYYEEKLFLMNKRILQRLLLLENYEGILNYLYFLNESFKDISFNGDIKYWHNQIIDIINTITTDDNYTKLEESKYGVSIIDLISALFINFSLSFSEYLKHTHEIVKGIEWQNFNYKQLLKMNNCIFNSENFVDFTKKIENEREVEGKVITSENFILEYLYMKISKYEKELLDIYPIILNDMKTISSQLSEKKNYISSAILNSKIIELNNKILFQLDTIEMNHQVTTRYNKNNYKYEDIDIESLKKELKKIYLCSIEQYSKSASLLYLMKYDINQTKYDFIGELYYNLTFMMLDLIYDNDFENFKKMYPIFFVICSIADEQVSKIIKLDINQIYTVNKYTMITIQFMNISGFALYYSHLKNDDRWEVFIKEFTKSIVKKDTENRFTGKCKASAELMKYALVGNTMLNSSIELSIFKYVSNTNLIKYKYIEPFYQKVIDSSDAIIKKFSVTEHGFVYDFFEIYLYYCLNKYMDNDKQFKTTDNWAERK